MTRMENEPPALILSGRLWELRDRELFGHDYPLHVRAHDRGSGVASIDVLVDGAPEAHFAAPRASDGRGLTADWSFDPRDASLAPGRHRIEVRAADEAGSVRTAAWNVIKSPLDPLPTEDELVAESVAFRRTEGLRADVDYVQSLINDPSTDRARDIYGVALTAHEAQLLADRDRAAGMDVATGAVAFDDATRFTTSDIAREVTGAGSSPAAHPDPIERYGADHPDAYAGSYLAQGWTYVGFTSDADAHLARLQGQTSIPLRAFTATHTLAHLEAMATRVVADDELLGAQGIELQAVATDVKANVVDVVVRVLTDRAKRYLTDRYGSSVRVSEDTIEPATDAPGCGRQR
jgi:hypothetical protein